jgi:hypothetical protein
VTLIFDIQSLVGPIGREVMIDKIPLMGYTLRRAGGFRESRRFLGSGGSCGAFKSVLSGGTARVAKTAAARAQGLRAQSMTAPIATATRADPLFDQGSSYA